MDRLNIKNEMAAIDRKDRDYYDAMTDEEKKKFAPYLMIRWSSCVGGDPMLQSYYLISANEKLNKGFFDVSTSQHKKLQWLLSTTVSPGMGVQSHHWISPKKKESQSKASKVLRKLLPELNEEEISLMCKINNDDDIKELARAHGWDDKSIKESFK
jgi:hypothetical protein